MNEWAQHHKTMVGGKFVHYIGIVMMSICVFLLKSVIVQNGTREDWDLCLKDCLWCMLYGIRPWCDCPCIVSYIIPSW